MKLIMAPSTFVARAFPAGLPLVRDQINARTSIFISALDPDATPGDPGLFGPGSATWDVMTQPAQSLAGARAALLQALSAPIITATDVTGQFRKDFAGRVSRTGAFVQKQNLGSMDEVYKSAGRVRAMHRTVKGVFKDGLAYDASDPHQQAWVSMTLTESSLVMAERYGNGRLSRRRRDEFVKEQSTHGALLDHRVDLDAIFADPESRAALQAGEYPLPLIEEGELPTTYEGLRAFMHAFTPDLLVTDHTRKLLDATIDLDGVPPLARSLIRPFILAVLATLPDEWHDLLAPNENRLEEVAAAHAIQTPMAMMKLLFGPSPALDAAKARVAAGKHLSAA